MKLSFQRPFVWVLAFGLVVGLAAPTQAQRQFENPARKAAAILDYQKLCERARNNFFDYRMTKPIKLEPRSEFLAGLNWVFVEARQDSTHLLSVAELQKSLNWYASEASRAPSGSSPHHYKCAIEVALRHALYGVPGYDHGASSSRPSAPAPRPNVAARPAPAPVAQKLPPARPAKMAAWSPNAMPTNPTSSLSAKYAAERADALASCSAAIRGATSPTSASAEAILIYEAGFLQDKYMGKSLPELQQSLRNLDAAIEKEPPSQSVTGPRLFRCLLQRRLAQIEGSPLAAGAVDGTLTPLSIGGQTPPWKQQGKDARIIASNGKSAMHCVKLEQVSSGDSKVGVGGRRLFNYCPEEVEITWCNTPGCSTPTGGNTWTVQPNMGWPVSASGEVRWAACLGRDTAAFVKGSHGLRYYCTEPLVKKRN